jgi:hypothetical protein
MKFLMGFSKKRGDDLEIVASTNEGGWDWRLLKGKNPLNPFKQFRKEIRDGEQVGENQGPDHHSFNIDLDPSNLFSCFNTKRLILAHFMLRFPRIGRAALFSAAG